MIKHTIDVNNKQFVFDFKSVSGEPLDNQTGVNYQIERGSIVLYLEQLPEGASIADAKKALFHLVVYESKGLIPSVKSPHKIAEWQIVKTDVYDDTSAHWKCTVTYEVVDEVVRKPKE